MRSIACFVAVTTVSALLILGIGPAESQEPPPPQFGIFIGDQSIVAPNPNFNVFSAGPSSTNVFEGNVGIGTTTPSDRLEIVTPAPRAVGEAVLRLRTTDTGDTHPAIVFQGNRGGVTSRGILATDSGGTAETAMIMFVQNGAGALVRPLIVEHSGRVQLGRGAADVPTLVVEGNGGNVGIGTMAPATRLHVVGDLTVSGVKNFRIDHPVEPARKVLVHAALEGPEAAVYYRGEAQLVDGEITIGLPGYFEALTRKDGRTVQLTPIGGWSPLYVASHVEGGAFSVRGDAGNPQQRFYWEVKAVRADVTPLAVELPRATE